MVGNDKMPQGWSWLVTARKAKAGKDGPTASPISASPDTWYGRIYDPEYNQTKTFFVSDRPVYRPDQKVQFKFWVRHAKYDQADTSDFAGKTYTLSIHNPRGEKVLEKQVTTDEFAGVADEFALRNGCMLGQYHVHITDKNRFTAAALPGRGIQEARIRGPGRGPEGAGHARRDGASPPSRPSTTSALRSPTPR